MKRTGSLLFVSLFLAAGAQASVDLIAAGSISGSYEDLSAETAAKLENGVPGNRLGGLGSGLAWAGGTTFLALPDRGPNAVPYNAAIDDTASYIDRFHTFNLALSPSDAGAALPFTLTPSLLATTLLSSPTKLVYGNAGAPALNAGRHINYFTGRSDGFDPGKPSSNASDARLDPESIRVSNDGNSVFVSDEYGPYVYRFDRALGLRTRAYKLPAKFAVTALSAQGSAEISGNTTGRVANKGMEGLAITPSGKTLVGILQSPLIQDGGTSGATTRIVTIEVGSGAVAEYAYPLTNIGTDSKPKYPTVSDIVAVNEHQFLVDERDGKGLGDNSSAAFKRFYLIDLSGAAEVSDVVGASDLASKAVSKTLFFDLVALLNAHGYASTEIPAKIEGSAFGPDVEIGGTAKHTLYIANDNDFVATVTDSNHPAGVDNPNRFFVFAFDDGDLPGYLPQNIRPVDLDLCRSRHGIVYRALGLVDDTSEDVLGHH